MKSISKKRLAIIGTVGVPANYGGFETLVEHIVEPLSKIYDVTVYCSSKKYPKENRLTTYKGAKLVYMPLEANGIQSVLYDMVSIVHAVFKADVLLVLGVPGAGIFPLIKMFTNKKIVVNIDGVEWKRDKWGNLAKLFLFWSESKAVRYSHIDIADNESIQDYTSQRYGTLSRVVEYGADHTLRIPIDEKAIKEYPFLGQPYAFKVCRIEPENNVHFVLEAFDKISRIPLVIIGNWDKSEYGSQLKKRFEKSENIHILDPIYNQEKLDLIRGNATIYVHGHSAGGTNPSLVEAMYLNLPIVAFGVSYNRVTTENKALYFTDTNTLIDLIQTINFDDLPQIGNRMFEVAKRRYTWSKIADKYHSLINEALNSSDKPDAWSKTSQLSNETMIDLEIAHLKINDKL
jgi:glycosyltransferase involved in cell wall biosynthesis